MFEVCTLFMQIVCACVWVRACVGACVCVCVNYGCLYMYIECDGDAEDHVMQEDHMIHDDITESNHQLPLTTGTDEPGLHDDDKIIQPTSSGNVTDGGKPEVCVKWNISPIVMPL